MKNSCVVVLICLCACQSKNNRDYRNADNQKIIKQNNWSEIYNRCMLIHYAFCQNTCESAIIFENENTSFDTIPFYKIESNLDSVSLVNDTLIYLQLQLNRNSNNISSNSRIVETYPSRGGLVLLTLDFFVNPKTKKVSRITNNLFSIDIDEKDFGKSIESLKQCVLRKKTAKTLQKAINFLSL